MAINTRRKEGYLIAAEIHAFAMCNVEALELTVGTAGHVGRIRTKATVTSTQKIVKQKVPTEIAVRQSSCHGPHDIVQVSYSC